jgi:hypothetical protein
LLVYWYFVINQERYVCETHSSKWRDIIGATRDLYILYISLLSTTLKSFTVIWQHLVYILVEEKHDKIQIEKRLLNFRLQTCTFSHTGRFEYQTQANWFWARSQGKREGPRALAFTPFFVHFFFVHINLKKIIITAIKNWLIMKKNLDPRQDISHCWVMWSA